MTKSIFILVIGLLSAFSLNAQKYSTEQLLGKFDPAKDSSFVVVEKKFTDRDGIYLKSEVMIAFASMYESALQEGVKLKILSATRNFAYQSTIWKRKWNLDKYRGWSECDKVADIMKYSSMPGTSRHHWGTDIDLNALENGYFTRGEGKKMYEWMVQHASSFGFYQTYTAKDDGRTGYEEEKWHWSYFPISTPMLAAYNECIKSSDIAGFPGSDCADKLRIIQLYVNGVEPAPGVK